MLLWPLARYWIGPYSYSPAAHTGHSLHENETVGSRTCDLLILSPIPTPRTNAESKRMFWLVTVWWSWRRWNCGKTCWGIFRHQFHDSSNCVHLTSVTMYWKNWSVRLPRGLYIWEQMVTKISNSVYTSPKLQYHFWVKNWQISRQTLLSSGTKCAITGERIATRLYV